MSPVYSVTYVAGQDRREDLDGRDEPGHDHGTRSDAGETSRRRKVFFIIFVDGIFTTLFECPFTKGFDVTAQTQVFPCVYRGCNAD